MQIIGLDSYSARTNTSSTELGTSVIMSYRTTTIKVLLAKTSLGNSQLICILKGRACRHSNLFLSTCCRKRRRWLSLSSRRQISGCLCGSRGSLSGSRRYGSTSLDSTLFNCLSAHDYTWALNFPFVRLYTFRSMQGLRL